MGKTLNHYSQQIKALAPDSLVLDRARELGLLLLEAKAAVLAAGRKWADWLEHDCALSARTAQRFMAIASRWDEPAFAEARQQRPDLPLREADKVLAASSTRKKSAPPVPRAEPSLGFGGGVRYYCPACTLSYASLLLEKTPVVRHLQCGGPENRRHPTTDLVPSLIDIAGQQFHLTPRDTSSYSQLPAVQDLVLEVCFVLINAGMTITGVEVSGAGGSLTIRSNDGPDDSLPAAVSLYVTEAGQVKEVFLGAPNSGGQLYATRGGHEYRGSALRFAPLWRLLEPTIPWHQPADQHPAGGDGGATTDLPVQDSISSDTLTSAGATAAVPQPQGPDALVAGGGGEQQPLDRSGLPAHILQICQKYGGNWPEGLTKELMAQYSCSKQNISQHRIRILKTLLAAANSGAG